MATMTAFDLEAVLKLNSSDYDTGLTNAEGRASSFGSKAGRVMGTVGKVTVAALAAASTAVVGFGKKSVEAGMSFDTSMSQVAATMGKTVADLDNEIGHAETSFGSFNGSLREFAQFMGANTAFTASQAADALNYMALAGYNTQESMTMLPNVLSLAAAGNMDLARASDMVTDAQTALGLSFEETNMMVDQMAKTASTTNTSVEQLGDAILTIGGTAQFMAGGTEELAAVLGVLADNGIKGSEAGTHLRNMILKLSAPTKEGAEKIKELGLNVYDAEGKMRSFEDIFTDLNAAMSDFTEEQKVQTFADLFNTRDVASATALLNTTTDRWHEVKAAIDDSTGAAAQMAETQLDNLAGDITKFQSALEGAQIVLSDQLTPTLREFVQFGTTGIQDITKGFQEGGLSGAMTALGNTISTGLGKVIEDMPTIIDAAISLIKSLLQAIKDNAPALLNAVVEVVGMILEELPSMQDTILDSVIGIVDALTEALPKLIPKIADAVVKLVTSLVDHLPKILDSVLNLVMAVNDAILTKALPILLKALPDIIVGIVDFILGAIPEIINAVIDITMALVDAIPQIISAFVQAMPKIITGIIAGLMENLPDLIDGLVKLTDLSLVAIPMIVVEIVKRLPEIITGIVNGLKESWPILQQAFVDMFAKGVESMGSAELGAKIGTAVGTFFGNMVKKVREWFNKVGEWFSSGFAKITDKFKEWGTNAKEAVTNFFQPVVDKILEIWNWFQETFGPLIEAFRELFSTVMEAIKVISERAWNAIAEKAEAIWTKISDFFTTTWTGIRDFFITIWNNIVNFVTPILERLKEIISVAWEWIKEKIVTPLQEVFEKVKEIWDNIIAKITEVVDAIKENVAEKFELIKETIREKVEGIRDKVGEIFDNIKEKIMGLVDSAKQWGKDMLENFANGIKEKISAVTDAVQNFTQSIKDRVGFSEPKLGPLSNFHTFAPDMMELFAKGIADNTDVVTDQIGKSFDFGSMLLPQMTVAQNSLQPATAGAPSQIIIPVYLGQDLIKTVVVDALDEANYQTGGR